jgi:adenosylhomocysteine nucleosidase
MLRALAALTLLALAAPASAPRAQRPVSVAVLGAMPEEIASFRERLRDVAARRIGGVEFLEGTLAGRAVVVARVGVGKVNAALTTTLLLEHYRPRRVVFTGVAGGLDSTLGPGDIVLARYAAQHDLGTWNAAGVTNWGASPAGDTTHNPVRFPGDTLLHRLARGAAAEGGGAPAGAARWTVREGTVLTGDVFLANDSVRRDLRRRFPDALAVEMEGAAVAQVCWQMGRVPLLVVRSISDGAGAGASEDFATFARRAARNSSELVARVVAALPAGTP